MKLTLTTALLIVSFVLSPVCSLGAIFEVRNATELHDALYDAGRNGESDTIRIFQGHYIDVFIYAEDESERNKMTVLKGGFSDEGDPSDDPAKTVLDSHERGCVLYCSVSGTIVIQNLTFQNGYGYAAGGLSIALHTVDKPGTALIMNSIFQYNFSTTEGGGLRVEANNPNGKAGNIWLIENIFTGNETSGGGGGGGAHLYVNAGTISNTTGHIVALGNTVNQNVSIGSGGGLYLWSRSDRGPAGKITVKGNTFLDNRAESSNTAADGGGIYVFSESRAEGFQDTYPKSLNIITFDDNTLQGNQTIGGSTDGGGAKIKSRSRSCKAAAITVKKNIVTQNTTSGSGGGLDVDSWATAAHTGDIVFDRNLVSDNHSDSQAGGAMVYSLSAEDIPAKVVITNNFIVENTSFEAGGLWAVGKVNLTNNTVAQNLAICAGGGVVLWGGETNGKVNVYNNIIWGNTATDGGDIFLAEPRGTSNGFYNDFGEKEGAWTFFGGNIHEDPRFKGNGNYHLRFSSPCRNAGTAGAPSLPSTDFDGQNRILGGAPEMGADELLDLYKAKYLKVKWPLRLQNLLKRVVKD